MMVFNTLKICASIKKRQIIFYKEIWKHPQDTFNEKSKGQSSMPSMVSFVHIFRQSYTGRHVRMVRAARQQKTETLNGLNNKIFLSLIVCKTKRGMGFGQSATIPGEFCLSPWPCGSHNTCSPGNCSLVDNPGVEERASPLLLFPAHATEPLEKGGRSHRNTNTLPIKEGKIASSLFCFWVSHSSENATETARQIISILVNGREGPRVLVFRDGFFPRWIEAQLPHPGSVCRCRVPIVCLPQVMGNNIGHKFWKQPGDLVLPGVSERIK